MNYKIIGNDDRLKYLDEMLAAKGHHKVTKDDINTLIILGPKEIYKGPSTYVIGGKGYTYSHDYRCKNSYLTAVGALVLATNVLMANADKKDILVLGYGYLGKAIAKLFFNNGASITVASQDEKELKLASDNNYNTLHIGEKIMLNYHLIINTIPAKILDNTAFSDHPKGYLLELASVPCCDKDFSKIPIINGSSLPGRFVPKAAASILYEEIIKNYKE